MEHDEPTIPAASPWDRDVPPDPMADLSTFMAQHRDRGEPIGDWLDRIRASDEPDAVAFRERWDRLRADREA